MYASESVEKEKRALTSAENRFDCMLVFQPNKPSA